MNLRQYRRSEVVQAARVQTDTMTDQVDVMNAYGDLTVLTVVGLGGVGGAIVGEWILIHPSHDPVRRWSKVSAADFAKIWEPVGGPSLF